MKTKLIPLTLLLTITVTLILSGCQGTIWNQGGKTVTNRAGYPQFLTSDEYYYLLEVVPGLTPIPCLNTISLGGADYYIIIVTYQKDSYPNFGAGGAKEYQSKPDTKYPSNPLKDKRGAKGFWGKHGSKGMRYKAPSKGL